MLCWDDWKMETTTDSVTRLQGYAWLQKLGDWGTGGLCSPKFYSVLHMD